MHDPSGGAGGVPSTSFFNFNQQNQQPAAGVGQSPVRAPPLTPGSTQFSAQPFQTFNGLPPQPRFQSRPSPAAGFRGQPQQPQPQRPRGPPQQTTSSVFGGNFGSNGNFFSVFNPAAFASPAARDRIQCCFAVSS